MAYSKRNVSAEPAAGLIKKAVDERGMSLNQVAQLCRVSTPTILRIHKGDAKTLHQRVAKAIIMALKEGKHVSTSKSRLSKAEKARILEKVVLVMRRELDRL